MSELEVSFNSPQCGWMSVGFEYEGGSFHTTTAAKPHETALSDVLDAVRGFVSSEKDFRRVLKWNRDPEEYDFEFALADGNAQISVVEYPTGVREEEGEKVFSFQGDPLQIAKAFEFTFQQMFEERHIDEFEENWHQEFPIESFTALRNELSGK